MASKADSIKLFSFTTAPMRAFHLTWVAFFICFFAWFACAPLMPVIKGEFGLSMEQVANINIAAVAITIFVRLLIGPLCDRYGPRMAYTGLLLLGSIPVLGVALSQSYESFLLFRLGIGAVGASFVITQYHTSVMFGPKVVGTANAAAAGWGNSGGGAAQALMPLMLTALTMLGVSQSLGWRLALVVPGVAMIVMAFVYWRYTQDCPAGNFSDLRKAGLLPEGSKGGLASFREACRNHRAWLLFVTYGACFGIEIFIHNIAAVYYVDHFGLSLGSAGLAAASFGLLALFARALGGWVSDRAAHKGSLNSRVTVLFVLMIGEGLGLLWFANADGVVYAVIAMLCFGLFTHMACGATYALVPFVAPKALGGVAGIVGAGGNVGAVAAGFLMKGTGDIAQTLSILSGLVLVASLCAIAARFTLTSAAATPAVSAA
ncbi:MFS transporter [Massilia yuzhufengensis]|uniref:MFS transporter, NNP family, nitrate/nitrite transporter n=1 Tax=Massilia yuzhufengensis TaxID=1164594 RepID=A0A1I1FRB3_9BURK|nr:MFS transporter [Massilia yuzhufengensis]SFC01811.1 MFS transporter, NNP family, nitrate/nitrite transporter [Massilia yuzhufengensis]